MAAYQLFVESLQVRLLHIQRYSLDAHWRIRDRILNHSVVWYVDKGSLRLTLNGSPYTCGEGELCLLPDQSVLNGSPLTGEVRLISLNFDAEILFLNRRGWAQAFQLPVIYKSAAADFNLLLNEMLHQSASADPLSSLLLQSQMLRMLHLLLQPGAYENTELPARGWDSRVHTVIHHLLSRPHLTPKVSELAEWVQLSESHLRKLFIRETGQAPLQFMHRLKVEQAKKLLLQSSKPIAEIAGEVGITDPNYFSRLFKLETGVAPQSYRKQYAETVFI